MTRPTIVRTEAEERDDFTIPHPATTAANQIVELEADLRRTADDFLHLPFRDLDQLVGGIPRGELWYVGAFSGDGKTTFLTSLTMALLAAGKSVYYLPTETPGKTIRGHLACKALGYDIGDFLSDAYLAWPDREIVVQRVKQEARKYGSPLAAINLATDQRIWVAESGFLTEHRIHAEFDLAHEVGADVVIVDHGDHTEDGTGSPYATSLRTQKALLTATHTYAHRTIVSTQFNLDTVKANRTLRYMAPRENYVYMGNIKRQLCDGMIGLYKTLKRTGLNLEHLKQFRKGEGHVKLSDILEPHTMCAAIMKHRKYGAREGERAYLHVAQGRVEDFPLYERDGFDHGIRTNHDV